MKSLFQDQPGEEWTDDSRELDRRANQALSALFVEFIERGFKAREIAHVVTRSIEEMESIACIISSPLLNCNSGMGNLREHFGLPSVTVTGQATTDSPKAE